MVYRFKAHATFACPPIAEGVLAERLAQAITGLDTLPGAVQLPVQPGYVYLTLLIGQLK